MDQMTKVLPANIDIAFGGDNEEQVNEFCYAGIYYINHVNGCIIGYSI